MQTRRLNHQRKTFRAAVGLRHSRRGLTLLEVVLALAIFMMAMAAIHRLMTTGARASSNASLQTESLLRCESLLAEIVAGRVASETTTETVFVDDPAWSWQSDVESVSRTDALTSQQVTLSGLRSLSVTVRRRNPVDEVIAISKLTRFATGGDGGWQ